MIGMVASWVKPAQCARHWGQGDSDHHVFVVLLKYAEVRLERRSVLPGYCSVVWRHGHIAEPTELKPDDLSGFTRDVVAVGRAIQTSFQPVKMNYLTLGNWVPHLHTHVLPRYQTDPAPGGPITWSDVHGEEVAHDLLGQQARALRTLLG